MTTRRFIAALITAAVTVGVLASPATAASDTMTDSSGDVVDDTGSPVADLNVDITGVTFTNATDGLRVVVDVATEQDLRSADWVTGDMDLDVWLDDPTDANPFEALIWTVDIVSGTAVGRIFDFSGRVLCETTISESPAGYTMAADEQCARKLSRTLQVQAELTYDILGPREHSDEAPDGSLSDIVAAAANGTPTRIAGTDRILTAIAISADEIADGHAGAVVLASSTAFPDALAGGPLAVASDAPLLLTDPSGLDARVTDEINRVLAPGGTVYLLGGTAALTDQVASDVALAGYSPQRVAGVTRFETAIAIADAVDAIDPHGFVLIADGRSFTDALIAGAAASGGGVVVLTDAATLPTSTRSFLTSDSTDQTAVGTNASTAVGTSSSFDRVTGANPSELSVNVADELTGWRGAVAIASDAGFPDSLAGGPHIARLGGALLLTDPTTLSPEIRTFIEAGNGRLREVDVYGGTAAVSDDVVHAIEVAL